METGQSKNWRLLRLYVEGCKRIQVVDVTPQRNVNKVGGVNAAGKTSLFDSIEFLFGGKKTMCKVPLRRGAESGQIIGIVGDDKPALMFKRTLLPDGKTELEITSADGFAAPTPQAIADSLYGTIAFDPTGFMRMKPEEQTKTLRQIVGLDFSEVDAKRKEFYTARTGVNATVKRLTAQVAGIAVPLDTPAEEVSVANLMLEQRRRQKQNDENQTVRARTKTIESRIQTAKASLSGAQMRLAEMEQQIIEQRKRVTSCEEAVKNATLELTAHQATVEVLEDLDVEGVSQQIIQSETTNRHVRAAAQKVKLEEKLTAAKKEAERLTGSIERIDESKVEALAKAKWPIPGLSFDDSGVLFNGLPLEQSSSAELAQISVAIGAALHPDLKVILLREAAMLYGDRLTGIEKFAEENDLQLWLELPGDGAGCSLILEDGAVKGVTTTEPAPAPEKPAKPKKAAAPVGDEDLFPSEPNDKNPLEDPADFGIDPNDFGDN